MTPQQIDAMKLALEALENYAWHEEACPQHPTYSEPEKYPKCTCGYDQAITAIKEALAEHAMRETQRLGQEIEQEPVAWMDADGNVSDNNDHKCFPIPLYTKEQP